MNDDKDIVESRKWLFTCNNPEKHGWSIDRIVEILKNWKAVKYWCIGREVGVENGTPHIHFFIYSTSAIKHTTIENKLHGINRKPVNKTIKENRTYVFKDEHYIGTEKGKLHDYDSNLESGDPPEEKGRGARTDLHELYDMIKDGMTDYQIMEACPQYMKQFDKIDKVRQTIRYEQYADCWRDLSVIYIWGSTGAGKTRHVMETYGYRNVYRVTDYLHPFDSYKGQDIVVFEEFRSDIKLGDMLNYLDGYPVELSARYNNKYACFTKVFIISNIDIRDQYPIKQEAEPESYKAFLRRVNEVWFTTGKGFEKYKTEEYMKNEWRHITNSPFDEEKGA